MLLVKSSIGNKKFSDWIQFWLSYQFVELFLKLLQIIFDFVHKLEFFFIYNKLYCGEIDWKNRILFVYESFFDLSLILIFKIVNFTNVGCLLSFKSNCKAFKIL